MHPLDELKKQRELIQKHLAWLDQEIAKQTSEPPNQSTKDAQPAREKLKLVGATPGNNPETTTRQETRHPFPEINETNELSNGVQPSQMHSDIAKAKIGCVVIFVGAVGLFLFLLFGLPYFIDDSGESETHEESVKTSAQ